MKFLLKGIKALFIYYNSPSCLGNSGIGYPQTITTLTFFFVLNVFTLYILTGIELELINLAIENYGTRILGLVCFISVILLIVLFHFILPEKKILKIRLNPREIKWWKFVVLIYFIISFAMFVFAVKNN